MSKSKILGDAGTDNYKMSDCPFHLPKTNLKFFHELQHAANKKPYDNYGTYGNSMK